MRRNNAGEGTQCAREGSKYLAFTTYTTSTTACYINDSPHMTTEIKVLLNVPFLKIVALHSVPRLDALRCLVDLS
jgi:hypothetical protein